LISEIEIVTLQKYGPGGGMNSVRILISILKSVTVNGRFLQSQNKTEEAEKKYLILIIHKE